MPDRRRSRRIDTRSLGLEIGVAFARWQTGAENLHYGLWTGLEPVAGNLGAAQAAYTERLLGHLPRRRLRVLDIGGGAGTLAARLQAEGHAVEIVVPSAILAARCRANAPGAPVHETTFEAFETAERFDVCLFAESLQYMPADLALEKARKLLAPDGRILVADCFRSAAYRGLRRRQAGGGHDLASVRRLVDKLALEIVAEEDVTDAAAPSIDVEQDLYAMIGTALRRIDAELAAKRPWLRRALRWSLRLALGARRRDRLSRRLFARERTGAAFRLYNRYMIFLLRCAVTS